MSSLLAVLPVITHTYADACVASMVAPDTAWGIDPADVLVVDNTRDGSCTYPLRTYRDPEGHNLGVARSWNVGAREVLERGLDYLVLVSASMLFGPIMHTTWRAQMGTFWGCDVIESTGNSWHLLALHRRVLEAVGLFCAGFYPAYVEQIDYGYRMRQVGMEDTGRERGWRNVWCNAMSQAVAGHLPAVACPWGPLDQLYRQRWGGPKGEERWTLPYGDRPLDYDADADTPIPVLAERYGLGQRGKDWW